MAIQRILSGLALFLVAATGLVLIRPDLYPDITVPAALIEASRERTALGLFLLLIVGVVLAGVVIGGQRGSRVNLASPRKYVPPVWSPEASAEPQPEPEPTWRTAALSPEPASPPDEFEAQSSTAEAAAPVAEPVVEVEGPETRTSPPDEPEGGPSTAETAAVSEGGASDSDADLDETRDEAASETGQASEPGRNG